MWLLVSGWLATSAIEPYLINSEARHVFFQNKTKLWANVPKGALNNFTCRQRTILNQMTLNNWQCEIYLHAEANSQTNWKIQLTFSEWNFFTSCVEYSAPFLRVCLGQLRTLAYDKEQISHKEPRGLYQLLHLLLLLIRHWSSTSLASCNLKNRLKRFGPHIQCITITNTQRHIKRMLIVIHFNPSRSFFCRDLLLAA